jgi:hypothetical protein
MQQLVARNGIRQLYKGHPIILNRPIESSRVKRARLNIHLHFDHHILHHPRPSTPRDRSQPQSFTLSQNALWPLVYIVTARTRSTPRFRCLSSPPSGCESLLSHLTLRPFCTYTRRSRAGNHVLPKNPCILLRHSRYCTRIRPRIRTCTQS